MADDDEVYASEIAEIAEIAEQAEIEGIVVEDAADIPLDRARHRPLAPPSQRSCRDSQRSMPERDLRPYVDRFGHISVHVDIGHAHSTGANHKPAVIARFLRELADDVERAGDD